ncbi:unnamed protein product [Owenia fusiformis]|uniref:VWFA domain-containing protein n=1 Tax=Owenia fusiformis TaxID=6347 RepID=A0A8S4N2X5_OWEFU|nr:unnamed protein product [Owenia fusiformis]
MMLMHTIIVLLGMWTLAHADLSNLAKNRGIKAPSGREADVPDNFVGCLAREGRYQVAGVPGKPDEINECIYYKCVGNEWKPQVCPDKLGILESQFDKAGRTNSFPCTKPKNGCLSTLSERGVAETATTVCGVDLVTVIDVSCSIASEDKAKIKTFLKKFVSNFPIGPAFTQIAGSVYGSIVKDFLYFNTYNSARMVRKAIDEMPLDAKPCATHTFEALRQAREVHLTEEKGRRDKGADKRDCCVMLMTDGYTHPQNKKHETIREAANIRKICALILVTLPNSPEEEKKMPEQQRKKLREEEFAKIQPDGDMRLDLQSFDELEENINNIARKTCQPVNRIEKNTV